MEASLRATFARSSSRRLSNKKQASAGKSDTHLLQQSTAKEPCLCEAFTTFSLKNYVVIYLNAVNSNDFSSLYMYSKMRFIFVSLLVLKDKRLSLLSKN